MSKSRTVIFSDRAYNAIIRESFSKNPNETGGLLLGYRPYEELWIVIEVTPPGLNAIHQISFYQRDLESDNNFATSIVYQYKEPLEVLGLWHRHPGSMDYFSQQDNETNFYFASLSPYGAISGLVNIDPAFRLTMYHIDHYNGAPSRNIAYSSVEVEVGDDLIPEVFFKLRYVDDERSELHPTPTHTNTRVSQTRTVPNSPRNGGEDEMAEQTFSEVSEQPSAPTTASVNIPQKQKSRKWLLPAIVVVIFLVGAFVGVKTAPLFKSSETTNTAQDSGKERDKGDKGKETDSKLDDKGNKGDANHGKTSSDKSNNGSN